MGVEIELAVLLAVAVLGQATFAVFEVETPAWRKILKWTMVVGLTLVLTRFIGHWSLVLPLAGGVAGVIGHTIWCRKHGIDPVRATPRREYYQLRGWGVARLIVIARFGPTLALVALIGATVGCDRVTKRIALETLAYSATHSYLADTVRLEYTENAGAFLSLGADWPAWLRTACFTVGNGLMLVAVVTIAVQRRWSGAELIGLSLLIAGGVSNLADRIARGSVVDFLNVGVGPLRTGIFNVADMAIMGGVVLMAVQALRAALARREGVVPE